MTQDQPSGSLRRKQTVRLDRGQLPQPGGSGPPAPHPEQIAGFTVVRELGRGAMGVIFEAEDPLLARHVAIKALPTALADDPVTLERFKREARVLASMNHPGIGAIYGIEEVDERLYLILELVRGETLRAHLMRGALSVEETVDLCTEILTAIEGAHERGIIHRDLKPENIMIADDGRVKVVDFGLAKSLLWEEAGRRNATRQVPAAMASGKEAADTQDELVGTPAYMSPEQITCEDIDHRADIWGIGCLLYECVTGKRAFGEPNLWALLGQIVEGEPDWSLLPPDLPVELVGLIRGCLARDRERRTGTLAEVRAMLQASVESAPAFESSTNLPEKTVAMVGRDDDMRAILGLLRATRAVTLTGAGGCGKTVLAIALGRTLLDAYPDGVWLVELASLTEGERVPSAVASALRLEGDPRAGPLAAVTDCLSDKQALLIIDNCEHLLEACSGLITCLLTTCARLNVLATSRESLGIPGEVTYRVPSLASPTMNDSFDLDDIERFPAVRLFVERARAVCPDLVLDSASSLLIVQICSQLDGIPLAIELAAARTRSLPLEEIAQLLSDRFRLLVGGRGTALPRQQTLRALIDWSHDQLPPEERTLLRALGVFRGGFTLQAAVAVHGGDTADEFLTLDLLTRLVDKSLVQTEEIEREFRYRLLETIRQYALDRMVEAGEAAQMRGRHLGVFAQLAREAMGHLRGPLGLDWRRRLEREHENLIEALGWAASDPELAADGLEMALGLTAPWVMHGHLLEGREALERALAGVAEPAACDRAAAADGLARFELELGNLRHALAHQEEAVERWRELRDRERLSASLSALGNVLWRLGNLDAAQGALEEAMALTRELPWSTSQIGAVRNLAIVAYRRADLARAQELIEAAITQARAIRDQETLAANLQIAGAIMMRMQRLDEARALHEEARKLMEVQGFRGGVAMQLINLGNVAMTKGDVDVAERLYGDALVRARMVGRKITVIEALGSLAECVEARGDAAGALERYQRVLQLCRDIGEPGGIARCLRRMAFLAGAAGDLAAGEEYCRQRVQLAQERGAWQELAVALRELAALALRGGEPARAARLLAVATRSWAEGGALVPPGEQAEIDRLRGSLLLVLEEEEIAAAWDEGAGAAIAELLQG